MLTEAAPLNTRWSIDSPLNRLLWTLPTALLIWAVVLWALAYFMENPTQPLAPPPIDAQLIDQSVPAATKNLQLDQPAPPPPLKPRPPARTKEAPSEPPPEEKPESPVTAPALVTPNTVRPIPNEGQAAAGVNLPASSDTLAGPGVQKGTSGDSIYATSSTGGGAGSRTGLGPAGAIGGQMGSDTGKGTPGRSIYASSGARAIIRPMPQIPDELRQQAFNSTALARFHVAADGSTEVELAKPTPDPRLNRILLDSLKKWRFMPAIKNGKPVATTEEIVIKIEVK